MKMRQGFTLLEVLIATAIFAFSIIVLVQSRTASLRNTFDSQDMFKALQLAQSKMVEMELKYQSQLDKDGSVKDKLLEEENGVFDPPNDSFKWTAKFAESGIKFTMNDIRSLLSAFGMEKEDIEAQVQQQGILVTNINKVMKENFAELNVTVLWDKYGHTKSLPLVTHLIPSKPKIVPTMTVDNEEGGLSSATPSPDAGTPAAAPAEQPPSQ